MVRSATPNRFPNTFTGAYPRKHNARENKSIETALTSGRLDAFEEFREAPMAVAGAGYGSPTGVAGDTNLLATERTAFEYHIKGTQTILAPAWVAASGLNVAMDQTADDGVEITNGIGARGKRTYVVGTDQAFYAECTMTLADVSGSDDCAFGWRKAEAYQANIDDYDEGCWLNCISGTVTIESILNNAATSSTSTGVTVADAGTVTFRVEIGKDGRARFFVNGTESRAAGYKFDTGEVVVPFFFFLQDTDLMNTLYLSSWKVGHLYR